MPSLPFQSRWPAMTAEPGAPGVGPYCHHTSSAASPGIARPPVSSTPVGSTGPSASIDGTATRAGATTAAGVSTPTPTRASCVVIGASVDVVEVVGGIDVDDGAGGAVVDVAVPTLVVVTAVVTVVVGTLPPSSPPAATATIPATLGTASTRPAATA